MNANDPVCLHGRRRQLVSPVSREVVTKRVRDATWLRSPGVCGWIGEDMSVFQMVLPLVGVVIGAFGSFLATSAGERARWRRQQQTRWDARRVEAYAEYGDAVKRVYVACKQIVDARALGERDVRPTLEERIAELVRLSAERTSKWETVLLLGDVQTIVVARAWHRLIWEMERIARGESGVADDWERAWTASYHARTHFYEAARRELGVADASLPPSVP